MDSKLSKIIREIVQEELANSIKHFSSSVLKEINDQRKSMIARNVSKLGETNKDIIQEIWRQEVQKTAKYVRENLWHCKRFTRSEDIWEYALDNVTVDGLFLEFGVFQGKSINHMSQYKPEVVFNGFDSFVGLPDRWVVGREKGHFSLDGNMPEVNNNVVLHPGFFEESIPHFVKGLKDSDKVAFLHVDCDMYASAKTIFNLLGSRLVEGSIVLFDEYFNYPGWEDHEIKAFKEFIEISGAEYEYMAFHSKYTPVLTKITKSPNMP